MQFTLGALLPNAIAKMKKLLKAGRVATESWGQSEKTAAIVAREESFNLATQASQAEQWQLNALVHYNEWANMHRDDFLYVVKAFRELENLFTCQKCNSTLYITPDVGEAEALTCLCGESHFTMKKKAA